MVFKRQGIFVPDILSAGRSVGNFFVITALPMDVFRSRLVRIRYTLRLIRKNRFLAQADVVRSGRWFFFRLLTFTDDLALIFRHIKNLTITAGTFEYRHPVCW